MAPVPEMPDPDANMPPSLLRPRGIHAHPDPAYRAEIAQRVAKKSSEYQQKKAAEHPPKKKYRLKAKPGGKITASQPANSFLD
jgi:hypothetical protein